MIELMYDDLFCIRYSPQFVFLIIMDSKYRIGILSQRQHL